MKHHHFDIIQAYYSDPDKWDIFIFNTPLWIPIKLPLWEPTCSYKVVPKEKKKTLPARRYIHKVGKGYVIAHNLSREFFPETSTNFVRWVDNDWIEYEVDVDGENEIVSMARGD